MTADKHTTHAAHDVAAREGISYTAARRRLEEQNQSPAVEQPSEEPPRLYPIVMTPCTHGCVGTPHPGYVYETWHPFSRITGRPRTSWATRQAANLPRGRAESLTDRFREKPSGCYRPDDTWLPTLAYTMLLGPSPGKPR